MHVVGTAMAVGLIGLFVGFFIMFVGIGMGGIGRRKVGISMMMMSWMVVGMLVVVVVGVEVLVRLVSDWTSVCWQICVLSEL